MWKRTTVYVVLTILVVALGAIIRSQTPANLSGFTYSQVDPPGFTYKFERDQATFSYEDDTWLLSTESPIRGFYIFEVAAPEIHRPLICTTLSRSGLRFFLINHTDSRIWSDLSGRVHIGSSEERLVRELIPALMHKKTSNQTPSREHEIKYVENLSQISDKIRRHSKFSARFVEANSVDVAGDDAIPRVLDALRSGSHADFVIQMVEEARIVKRPDVALPVAVIPTSYGRSTVSIRWDEASWGNYPGGQHDKDTTEYLKWRLPARDRVVLRIEDDRKLLFDPINGTRWQLKK
jgi:hypothetical protein